MGRSECAYPEVERDRSGSPFCQERGPDPDSFEEEEGIVCDSSWIPEGGFRDADHALAVHLSLHICTESELKGHKVEVVGARVWKHDIEVVRKMAKRNWTPEEVRKMVEEGYFHAGAGGSSSPRVRGKRKACMSKKGEPTYRSLLEFYKQLRNTDVEFKSALCLTYGKQFPMDGRICARHQHAFHTALQRRYGSVEYAWAKEWQDRFALHLHYATTIGEADIDRLWFADTWTRIIGGNHDVHFVHRRIEQWQALYADKEATSRYFSAYVSNDPEKKKQKRVPPGFVNPGRPWGVSRGVKPKPIKFVAANAAEIVQRVGFDAAIKFVKQTQDGKYHPRNHWWGQAEKFC